MIKRTIEVSRQPLHLSVKHDQLVLQARGQAPGDAPTIPCEDIGIVVVDEPGTSWSHQALAKLMEHGAAVVVCGRDHLPAGMLLPFSTHTEVVTRINEQIAVKRPVKKRLWKQLVVAKIRGQARNLDKASPARLKLLNLSKRVKSGDPSNIEAQAAKVYWHAWLGEDAEAGERRFRRDPHGPPPNNLLNYGYAVLRAAIARAQIAAGMLPAIGMHHSNRSNAFCLADDLLEPLRPIVDDRVRQLHGDGALKLDQPTKAALLGLLVAPAEVAGQSGPLMVNLHRMVASLVRCYQGQADKLDIPAPC